MRASYYKVGGKFSQNTQPHQEEQATQEKTMPIPKEIVTNRPLCGLDWHYGWHKVQMNTNTKHYSKMRQECANVVPQKNNNPYIYESENNEKL